MEYQIKEYSIHDAGHRTDSNGHPHQEDSLYPPQGENAEDARLFMVCDGMGGHDAGEVASAIVCDTISEEIEVAPPAPGHVFSVKDLEHAIAAAYDALDAADTGSEKKMGTTLALLKLYERGYMIAHIGDSRVYHIRPGKTPEETRIIYRTVDHTLVNYLIRTGKMTPEEALTSPKRHVITRAMQPHMERRSKADIYQGDDVQKGDYFLIGSDGIFEHIDDEYLTYLFSEDGGSAKNKIMLLAKATSNNDDNHTAIIVQVTDVTYPDAVSVIERKPIKKPTKPVAMKKTGTKGSKAMSTKAKQFVDKHTANGGTMELLIKFLFALMGLLVVIMLIYYLFIRSNEDLQRAGTAVDAPIEGEAGDAHGETYGYEITAQDIINEAQEIAPEEPLPTDDVTTDEPESPDITSPAEEPVTTPTPADDEPILQE